MAVDAEVLGWLHDAAAAAVSWEDVASFLRHRAGDDNDRARPFVVAFSYSFHEQASSSRERAGGPYGALIAGDGWRFPPALDEIDEETVVAWRKGHTSLDHAVVQARLGDLLWERKVPPNPHLAAATACDGLIAVAATPAWRAMDRVRCASRALELARAIRDDDRQASAIAQMLSMAMQDLESGDGGPGIPLGLLRAIVALPAPERPGELDALLVRVDEKYGVDPHISNSVAELRTRLVSEPERVELRRQQVARWRAQAATEGGMLRVVRLERALAIARKYGLTAEANDVRRELASITNADLDLKRISTEVDIDRGEVERFLADGISI